MLTLTRRVDQSIRIGDDVEVVVVSLGAGKVRLAVRAPRGVPIHRGELVARIVEENERARGAVTDAPPVEGPGALPGDFYFEQGLWGLRSMQHLRLEPVEGVTSIQRLVCVDDPMLHLFVAEAIAIAPDYPTSAARRAAGVADDPAWIAVVVSIPADGEASANLVAPIVVDLSSGRGVQVILDDPALPLRHPIRSIRRERPPIVEIHVVSDGGPP